MALHDESDHPFAGIAEKLNRAKENIFNLDSEIALFFQKGDYPTIPEHDPKIALEAIKYHKGNIIPLRFNVLAGEIVHHLRSCFDHVVWIFSTGAQINNMPIDFPVFLEEPIKEKHIERFKGKIQRITNLKVRSLIESLQPYKATYPADDPLWIIHDFDIIDKHRELVLSDPTGVRYLPIELKSAFESYQGAHPELNPAEVAYHFKEHGPLMPNISFRNIGRREMEPVIPSLANLFDYTVGAMEQFTALL